MTNVYYLTDHMTTIVTLFERDIRDDRGDLARGAWRQRIGERERLELLLEIVNLDLLEPNHAIILPLMLCELLALRLVLLLVRALVVKIRYDKIRRDRPAIVSDLI